LSGFSIELLGLHLGFTASAGRAAELVERYMFPPLHRSPERAEDISFRLEDDSEGFRISRGGAVYACAAGSDEALVLLQQAVDEYVVQHASGFAFVHCGAVGVGGDAVLLIASSGHGKSTLVEELAGRADYYSDEYAAIDADGKLHAYPRSLLLRSGRPVQHPVTPLELGARVAVGPAEIRLVLEIPYHRGESGIRVAPLEQSEALHLLLKSTPQALEDHPGIFSRLAKVAARARAYNGTRGEARDAARAILELLAAHGAAPQ
jgi:hypothetical protein